MAGGARTKHDEQAPLAARGSRWAAPGLREVLLAFLGLIAVGVATLGHYVAHGGFYLDDWADSSGTLYPPGGRTFSHVLDYFANIFDYRPVLIVFTPLKYSILGGNIELNLAWTLLFGILVSLLFYSILRTLSVPRIHAWLISALTLVYPWFDSVRLWASDNPPLLGIFFAFAGIQVALSGVIRRSWRWHLVALFLYALSILSYEITAPLIAVAGALYWVVGGFRRTRLLWAADLVVVVAGALWVGLHTTRSVSGVSADLTHLREIVEGGKTIVARSFDPLGNGPHTALALGVAAAVLAVGAGLFYLRRRDGLAQSSTWGLREWLLLAAAGFALAVLGWVMFIPADPYYTPVVFGITNRVNALSGFGVTILAYAVTGTFVSLFADRLPPSTRRWSDLAIVALMVVLGAVWVHVLERHAGIWETAYRSERSGLDKIEKAYPKIPDGTTIFASGSPAYETLGVAIFAFPWDLNGAVHLEYGTSEIAAYPVLRGSKLVCLADGVRLVGREAPEEVAPYGRARFIDLVTGVHAEPRDRRRCERLAPHFVAGPEYVQYAY